MASAEMTVSQLSGYLGALFDGDPVLSSVSVRGEISNFKAHSSGHLYFSLKDAAAMISCVMFRSDASRLTFDPSDGMEVTVAGRVGIYDRDGKYQIYVRSVKSGGAGALYEAYARLLGQLEDEGFFSAERKRALPAHPKKIAVLTSPTGAVIRDIISVAGRRSPSTGLFLFPVPVQGAGAAGRIAAMIAYVNAVGGFDVIIVARGGGSIEELWPFNERVLAQAVFDSAIPVVSGVGHETDVTICDFVSDMRAPTPSAAAELCVPDTVGLSRSLSGAKRTLERAVSAKIAGSARQLDSAAAHPFLSRPLDRFSPAQVTIDHLSRQLSMAALQMLAALSAGLSASGRLLDSFSHEGILRRGYASLAAGGQIIAADDAPDSGPVEILTATRTLSAQVESSRPRQVQPQGGVENE